MVNKFDGWSKNKWFQPDAVGKDISKNISLYVKIFIKDAFFLLTKSNLGMKIKLIVF